MDGDLRAELAQAEAELADLRAELTTLSQERKRLETAIKAAVERSNALFHPWRSDEGLIAQAFRRAASLRRRIEDASMPQVQIGSKAHVIIGAGPKQVRVREVGYTGSRVDIVNRATAQIGKYGGKVDGGTEALEAAIAAFKEVARG